MTAIVLLLPLLVGAVVVQSLLAERSRRETAARALDGYAAVAAWQFARFASDELHDVAQEIAIPLSEISDAPSRPLPPAELALEARHTVSRPAVAASVAFAFRVDLQSRTVEVAGGDASPATRRWLAERLPAHVEVGSPDSHRSVVGSVDGRRWWIPYYVVRSGRAGAPRALYGLALHDSVLVRSLGGVARHRELLPPALAGPPPQTTAVAVRVMQPSGAVIFEAGPPVGRRHAAADTLSPAATGLTTVVSLDEAMLSSTLLAGAPLLPLGAPIALFVLALVLAAVALVQLRRGRELARLRAEFVANVSHELRTPLAQISVFGETLMHGRERSEQERRYFAGVIFRESRRLTTLVESVLRFARGSSPAQPLAIEPRDLAADLADVLAAFHPIAEGAGAALRLELSAPVHALADAAALRQIVLNLLDNAIKYGPRGQTVTVRAEQAGAWTRVSVSDEGPGIPPAARERAFEPFVRLERAAGGRVAGTGIGLAVVRELTGAMGGRARLEDAPGGGARAVVELPAPSAAVPAAGGDTIPAGAPA